MKKVNKLPPHYVALSEEACDKILPSIISDAALTNYKNNKGKERIQILICIPTSENNNFFKHYEEGE